MISSRKNYKKNINSLFPLFLETTNDLMMILEAHEPFKVHFFNECEFLSKMAFTYETLTSKSFLNLVHPKDFEELTNFFNGLTSSNNQIGEFRLLARSGDSYWVKIIARRFINHSGKVKIFAHITDLSYQKNLEIKLKEIQESEEKYRDMAEMLPDIIFETDKNLNLTYVNSIAFKKFGFKPEEFNKSLKLLDFVHPNYKEKASVQIASLFEGKKTKPNDYLLCKIDGTCFYARIHSRPVYKDGNVVGIRGIITDVNDMILAEQELKESEEKFRTIAEQSFMGIIVIQDGVFKYYNEQARELNGYSDNEIMSWEPYEFSKLIHPEDKEFVINQAKKKEKGEEDVIQHYKYRLIKKSGEIRWIENFSKTIMYKGRTADLVMSVDITEKIQAEDM
ncbi:MAG: PAS domain S-box protein, partial [Promethearchaeota archaeon]